MNRKIFPTHQIIFVSFVWQSEVWVDDPDEKEKLIKTYKDALRYNIIVCCSILFVTVAVAKYTWALYTKQIIVGKLL